MKIALLIISISLIACSTKDKPAVGVSVSIPPLAYLVERIADTTVAVNILVPETTSPETFEPTPRQLKEISQSRIYISIGLIDFERELNKSITKLSDSLQVVDLSDGVGVMAGSCSHADHAGHIHGIDPHTWLSPRLMRGFSQKIAAELCKIFPKNKELYNNNLKTLIGEIDSLDSYIISKKLKSFAIGHPSLTYFARDYGIEQFAIEVEGKEPSATQMREIIDRLKKNNIKVIVYNRRLAPAAAETIARETGTATFDFDPLARDWLINMYRVVDVL
ncbi:Zinc ABC transporter [Mucinivorans hirudinis]|uniref:Zinc ABC transporter n=1 Tax=Mucinivorans hirudinis TaxID=1433126 RepID=A0A060R7P5_9BACT|nr:Zinc ABC transporter [Mucinivorans hirudinis]